MDQEYRFRCVFANLLQRDTGNIAVDGSKEYEQNKSTDAGKEIIQQIENTVGNYGVVAEKVTVNVDFESNVKADYLVTNRQTVGSSAESKGGYSDNDSEEIYIGDFADGEYVQNRIDKVVPTDVVIGLDANQSAQIITKETNPEENLNPNETKVIVTTTTVEGTETIITTKTITIANNTGTVSAKQKTTTVADELKAVTTLAEQLKSQTNESNSVEVVLSDDNTGTKTISANEKTCDTVYVDISGQSSLFNGNDGAHNKIFLNEDQTVVFNITPSGEEFSLDGYVIYVGQSDASSSEQQGIPSQNQTDTPKYADQIIFNFGNYAGKIWGGNRGIAANIIAPNAIVTLGPTSTGQVIAKEVSNPSGEWHYNGRYDGSTTESTTESITESTTQSATESSSTSTSQSYSNSQSDISSTSQSQSESMGTSESGNVSASDSTSTSEIPDEDVPLGEIPTENPDGENPVDIPDEDVPLATVDPDELVELPDDPVPLADANPETGDSMTLTWLGTAIAAVTGLFGAAKGKKKKDLFDKDK